MYGVLLTCKKSFLLVSLDPKGQTVTYTCADYVTCACLRHLYMQELLLRHLYIAHTFWWGGWGGWDDSVPWTCTHTIVRVVGGWGGWGGWDENVPWTCTHSSRQIGRWGVGLAGLGNLYFMYAVTYT